MTEREKTHHECKCPECDTVAAMAERMDAWKAAEALLKATKWSTGDADDVIIILPSAVLELANWLLTGTTLADGKAGEED